MRDFAALGWLDWHILLNRIRQIRRSPARLVLWLIFVAWFSFFFMGRGRGALAFNPFHDFAAAVGAVVPALYLALIGLTVARSGTRPPFVFAYPADAHFLLGSRLAPALVVFWMQAREAAFTGLRTLISVLVMTYIFAGSTRQFAAAAVAIPAALALLFSLRLPAYLLARRRPKIPVALIGGAVTAVGATAAAYPVIVALRHGGSFTNTIAASGIPIPPGTWLVGAIAGDIASLAAFCGLAVATAVLASFVATDCYPEIWDGASRLYAFRSAVVRGGIFGSSEAWKKLREMRGGKSAASTANSAEGRRTPSGVWALLWKEWLALRRQPGGLRTVMIVTLLSCATGYGLGVWLFHARAAPIVAFAAVLGFQFVVFFSAQSTISLREELRRPLWSLPATDMRWRLVAWCASGTARAGAYIGGGLAAALVGARLWWWALISVPMVLGALVLLQAIGLACYVVLPGQNDMRGPGVLLRMLTTMSLLVPVVVLWALAQWLGHGVAAGALAGTAAAALEIYALVSFAAWRLEGNTMMYAVAENR